MGLSAPVWLRAAVSRIITDDRWAGAPAFLTRSQDELRETRGGLSRFAGRRSELTANWPHSLSRGGEGQFQPFAV